MNQCEDYPCCGHVGSEGPCPDFDENGNQLNIKCVCGVSIPLNSQSSLCKHCLMMPMDDDDLYSVYDYLDDFTDDDDHCLDFDGEEEEDVYEGVEDDL